VVYTHASGAKRPNATNYIILTDVTARLNLEELYSGKFSRVLIFAVFADQLHSAKIKTPNFNPHVLYAITVRA